MLAGMAAAGVWAAAEPALGRLFRTPYSDLRLLAGLTGRQTTLALALHLANGAAFGATFERMGGRGIPRAVLAAEIENLALWPAMGIVDRVHPSRRDGSWPSLLLNGRVFTYEVAVHALFGAVLGSLLARASRAARSSAARP
jgi:hypothetical protein